MLHLFLCLSGTRRLYKGPVKPDGAFYRDDLREFTLPYDRVPRVGSPDEILLQFLQTTYEAAANLAQWDRAALERSEHPKTGYKRG
jgi:Family of unknown function (DUF5996)